MKKYIKMILALCKEGTDHIYHSHRQMMIGNEEDYIFDKESLEKMAKEIKSEMSKNRKQNSNRRENYTTKLV